MAYLCNICGKTVDRQFDLQRHINTVHSKESYNCKLCDKTFNRRDNLKKHESNFKHYNKQSNKDSLEAVTNENKKDEPKAVKKKKSSIKKYRCKDCKKYFTRRKDFRIHLIARHKKILCEMCEMYLPTRSAMIKHLQEVHNKKYHTCTDCGYKFLLRDELDSHRKTEHSDDGQLDDVCYLESAFNGTLKTTRVINKNNTDLTMFMSSSRDNIRRELMNELDNHPGIKTHMALRAVLHKRTKDGLIVEARPTFRSRPTELFGVHSIEDAIDVQQPQIEALLESFRVEGSGWELHKILYVDLHTAVYQPLRGSSYITTPLSLRKKRGAVLNIQNDDEKCFVWAILASLYPAEGENETSPEAYKTHINDLNLTGINFPTSLTQIDRFENQNPDISINIFGLLGEEVEYVIPIRISKLERKHEVDLLLISDDDGNQHYITILCLSSLLNAQYNKHRNKTHFCRYCLHGFSNEERLAEHKPDCRIQKPQRIKMPDEGTKLSFIHHSRKFRSPYVCYVDFECTLTKCPQNKIEKCKLCKGKEQCKDGCLGTELEHKHEANAFCMYIVC
jgi:DNA-directed RNA polymerase subunit RPC12/RpoP